AFGRGCGPDIERDQGVNQNLGCGRLPPHMWTRRSPMRSRWMYSPPRTVRRSQKAFEPGIRSTLTVIDNELIGMDSFGTVNFGTETGAAITRIVTGGIAVIRVGPEIMRSKRVRLGSP